MTRSNVIEMRPPSLTKRIDRAFDAASLAAMEAYAALRQTWPVDETGGLRDASGVATIYVRATRSLKRALLQSDRVVPNHGLRLVVRTGHNEMDQSITAREAMAGAAISVLNRHLGDLGTFTVESRMD